MKKINLLLIPFLAFCMAISACNKRGGNNSNVEVTGVSLDQTSLTMYENEQKELKATVTPDNATDKTVTWSSSNAAVATVSGGLVKALKEGNATITASAGNYNATCNVKVNKVVISKVLQAVRVTPPNKTTYYVGDQLDTTGLVVTAVYTDRSEERLTSDKYTVSGFDSSAPAANQTVTVSYTYENKTKSGTFNVTILEIPAPEVTGIEIESLPTKAEYEIGDQFESAGLSIKVTYSDGSTKIVNSGLSVSGFSSTTAGKVRLTVTYEGKSATFEVTIKQAQPMVTITGIEVTTKPTKLEYEIGEALDKTGMVVKAVMSDGTKEEFTGWTVSDLDSTTAGEKELTVTYVTAAGNSFTTTFKVTVLAAKELVSIALNVENAKTTYEYNEDLDTSGVVVTAHYDRGEDQTIAIANCTVTGYSKTTEGQQTITVTYGGQSKTYTVTVNEKAPELQSILLDVTNAKTVYTIGEDADFSGLVVKAHYDKGDDVTLTSAQYEISGFDSTASGTKTITVTYNNLTETFDVTVNESAIPPAPTKTLSSIAITTAPTKTTYYVGEELETAGLVVTATYSDDSQEVIANNQLQVSGFDSSVAVEGKIVTITYEGKTATFTVNITEAPVVHADYIIFYKKGSADWTELALVQNNDHEYKLENKIHFDIGDKFIFHMTGDDWRKHSDIKDGGANAKFTADGDDNFVVQMEGDYQFYVDTNGSAPSVYTERDNIVTGLVASYSEELAFVGGTINGNQVNVHYTYDDGSNGANIAGEDGTSFYIMVEIAQDTYSPYPVTDQTVIGDEMLGNMRVYADVEGWTGDDPYFDVEVIYRNYVHHQVGQNFVDTPLNEDYFEHKCAIIDLEVGDKFAVRSNGVWTSGLCGDGAGQGNYDQSGDLMRTDYSSIWDHSSDLDKVQAFPYDVTWQATVAGSYVVGVHEDNGGVIAYRMNWTLTINRASDPLNPEVINPTNMIFREYQFLRLALEEGDVLTIQRDDIKYGYDYVSGNSLYQKFTKNGAIEYFAGFDGTNSFVVKAGCGGVYSLYLKHQMVYYSTPGYPGSATYYPELYIVKEDIWHYTKGATDEEMSYDPFDSANKVILSNVDLVAGDEIGFYNAIMEHVGYSNIADNEQKAHFTQGENNKLVVKDGHAGAYTFRVVRSTGAVTVDYTSVEDQHEFLRGSYYVVGTADFSGGESVDGASWSNTSKALLMVADDANKPQEYDHQYKATVKFRENDQWKIRTNIYMPYNLENAGALQDNYYMQVQDGNIKVNRAGTYDIYIKVKVDGYCSIYISKAIDFTMDKTSITVGVDEAKVVNLSYSDGRDFTTDLEATSASNSIATAEAAYSLKKVTITGKAVGNTTVTVTDGRTSQVITVTVIPQAMPASGFGIIYANGTTFEAGTDAGTDGAGREQYKVEKVHLLENDKFKVINFGTDARWKIADVESSSFANALATYLGEEDGYYKVLKECYVDIYIKISADPGDQMYFFLYDLKLGGAADNVNSSIRTGGTDIFVATDWAGTLEAVSTNPGVANVEVNQETGAITITAGGSAENTTITVTAGGMERTISVTVYEAFDVTFEADFSIPNGWGNIKDYSLYVELDDGTKLLGDIGTAQNKNNMSGVGNVKNITVAVPTGKSITKLVIYFYQGEQKKYSTDITDPTISATGAYIIDLGPLSSWGTEGELIHRFNGATCRVKQLELNKNSVTLLPTGTDTITVSNWTGSTPTASGNNASIATVEDNHDGTFTITGVAPGDTSVTITDGVHPQVVTITINDPVQYYEVVFMTDFSEPIGWGGTIDNFSLYIELNDGTKLLGDEESVENKGNMTGAGFIKSINVSNVPVGKSITKLVIYFYQNDVRKYSNNISTSISAAGSYVVSLGMTEWHTNQFDGATCALPQLVLNEDELLIANGGTGTATAMFWTGNSLSATGYDNTVVNVSIDQETGVITFIGLKADSTTVTITDGVHPVEIVITVHDFVTVYFTDALGWGYIKAYIWNTADAGNPLAAWPGNDATWLGKNNQNQDIFCVTIDVTLYNRVIFSNNKQTVDIVVSNNMAHNAVYTENSVDGSGHYEVGEWDYVPNP